MWLLDKNLEDSGLRVRTEICLHVHNQQLHTKEDFGCKFFKPSPGTNVTKQV